MSCAAPTFVQLEDADPDHLSHSPSPPSTPLPPSLHFVPLLLLTWPMVWRQGVHLENGRSGGRPPLFLRSHTSDLSCSVLVATLLDSWGRYHGGRRPSSDDSFHSSTVIPPSALGKPSIMKLYHRRRTCSHTSPRSSPTMVTLHDTRFVEWRRWNDGWSVKTVVT